MKTKTKNKKQNNQITKNVEVRFIVEVTLDKLKFDEKFMKEFADQFYPFSNLDDHAEHIAQMKVRGILEESFTEGYGPLEEMGIRARVVDCEQEVLWNQEEVL